MTINKLTLDQPTVYEVTVPGIIDEKYLDWNGGLTARCPAKQIRNPITILRITVDQAGLHGFLRYLYSLGLSIISVTRVDYDD